MPQAFRPSQEDTGMTDHAALEQIVETAFDNRDSINAQTRGEVREAVDQALDGLDSGALKVATRAADGSWTVHQWLKKAVLLSFRLNDMALVSGGPEGGDMRGREGDALHLTQVTADRFHGAPSVGWGSMRRSIDHASVTGKV